jgi:hypothetical protein
MEIISVVINQLFRHLGSMEFEGTIYDLNTYHLIIDLRFYQGLLKQPVYPSTFKSP